MMPVGGTSRSRCNRGPFIVGRGPVPRHRACTRNQRSRGTGPRATIKKRFLSHRGGQAPALRKKTACTTVGRGPVPRHRSRYEKTSLVLLGPLGP